jgi:hypothetical protein
MLRSLQGPQTGLVFFAPPNRRQRLAQRRAAVIAAIVGLALVSGVVGVVSVSRDAAPATSIYLPSR